MKNLIIIGAGGVGGFIAHNLEQFEEDYNLLGFLDDNPDKIGQEAFGYKVLGSSSKVEEFIEQGAKVAIGIAFPNAKRKIVENLKKYNPEYPAFISGNSWHSKNVKFGQGAIIYPGVSINYNSVIEDFAVLNMNCALGHDCKVGKYSSLAPGVNFAGFTKIGETTEIGIGVCTVQNTVVGNGCIVGGQTMITKNIEDNKKVVGVPGKVIG